MDEKDRDWLLPGPNNINYLGGGLTSRMVAVQHRGGTDNTPIDQVFPPLEVTEAKVIAKALYDQAKTQGWDLSAEETIIDLMTTAFFAGTQTMYIATVGGLDRLRMEEIMAEEEEEENESSKKISQTIDQVIKEGGTNEEIAARLAKELGAGVNVLYVGKDPEEAIEMLSGRLQEVLGEEPDAEALQQLELLFQELKKIRKEDGTKDS